MWDQRKNKIFANINIYRHVRSKSIFSYALYIDEHTFRPEYAKILQIYIVL